MHMKLKKKKKVKGGLSNWLVEIILSGVFNKLDTVVASCVWRAGLFSQT